ncbi:dihydrofolate reductase family protein [Cellulomonas edaphi]|uniref:Dihydrofolate reductase family protein n=1 Tax=Cellulomonas edaphi TaxID=3053468 RepID=A0ABT7S8W1_9CELL|nr:dihydrofolate reductase family protein [Cellulomons edaphi]MDM7832062.1 dihydrofolate reductase family protein [Cellulomons edaphi]
MRKVVLYALTSLDGAVDDPGRYFPGTRADVAGPPVFDEVLARLEAEMVATQDAVLLGRGMYDEWSGFWPTADEPFAPFINGVRKYVVTSSPLHGTWSNAEAVAGPVADVVHRLRALPGGDIGVHGSISLARSLLALGLVDELNLAVGRVIDPVGRRLFADVADLQVLELVRAVPTPAGSLWLTYRRT